MDLNLKQIQVIYFILHDDNLFLIITEEILIQIMTMIMMHPVKEVRKIAFSESSRILDLDTDTCDLFISAVGHWQKQGIFAPIFQVINNLLYL